ncbi:hypothetical protein ABIF83_004018 [Bradyrhizobium ottawaense]
MRADSGSGQHQREHAAECRRDADAAQPGCDEARRPRQRTGRPERHAEIGNDQREAGNQQARADRKQPGRPVEVPAKRQEAREQDGQPKRQQRQSRQCPALRIERPCGQQRHELEQRATQDRAQPANANHVHDDERVRPADVVVRKAEPGDNKHFREQQPYDCDREVADGPFTEAGSNHGCFPSRATRNPVSAPEKVSGCSHDHFVEAQTPAPFATADVSICSGQDQLLADRVADELSGGRHPELAHGRGAMGLDGLHTQFQDGADRPVGMPLRDQLDHALLA